MRKRDRTLSTFDPRQPWMMSLLILACIPLFPEYIAPLLAIVSLLFASRDAKRHHRHVRVGAAGRVMITFLTFFAVHLLWAKDRLFSSFTLLCWIAMLCVYLSLTTILTSRRRIETALFTLSTVVGILGVIACVQYVCVAILGMDISLYMVWESVDRSLFSLLPIKIDLGSASDRACATFTNPNLFAQFMALAIPLVAAYAFTGQRSASKILSRLSLLFAVAGLLVSFSRGAYLALGAIAIVMCIANIRRLISILMVLFSVVLLLPGQVYDRLASIANGADHAILERLDLWGIAMQLFLQAPLFGHGVGISASFDALVNAGFYSPHVHNVFLQFLVEGGVLGMGLLLFMIWKLFRTGFELIIHTSKTRMYGAAVIAFCAGFCVCGMVDYPLFTPKTVAIFMIMLALTDAFGFSLIKRPSCTVVQALPFYHPLRTRLEAWVQKKTAPKSE